MLPLAVNEVTQVGLEAVAAAFAYGAAAVRFLLRAKPRHDVSRPAPRPSRWPSRSLPASALPATRVATIETDDPDALGEALRAIAPMDGAAKPATFAAVGGKRDVMRLALARTACARRRRRSMSSRCRQGAPFGTVEVNVEGCTLCLSCVSACPTGALSDDPERPMLRFAEDACVQCGLCKATCPEKVITLKPQLDFRAATATSRVLKQEEPFALHPLRQAVRRQEHDRARRRQARRQALDVSRTRKTRLDVIKMCEDCRVSVDGGGELRSVRRAAAPDGCAPPTIICASAKASANDEADA